MHQQAMLPHILKQLNQARHTAVVQRCQMGLAALTLTSRCTVAQWLVLPTPVQAQSSILQVNA